MVQQGSRPEPQAEVPTQSHPPLSGTLALLLAQCLLLPLRVLPQLLGLAQVALCSLLLTLQQLGFMQVPEPPDLLLVLGNELLDLGLQT